MNELDHERSLERLVDRVLRDQPLQQAPSRLAARVFAEIERREALAWWQLGFQAWPSFARALFAVASLALVAFAIEAPEWLLARIDLDMPIGVSRGLALGHALMTIASSIANSIPGQWMYAILGTIGVMYAVCFSAGAAAYRALVESR